MKLFDHIAKIVVGTLDVSNLKISFEVSKSTKPEPNVASVTIWQLSDSSRAVLEGAGDLPCSISAGYPETVAEIFNGTLHDAYSEVSGTEIYTTITSTEGGKDFRKARISRSYSKGSFLGDIIADVAAELGDVSQVKGLLAGIQSRLGKNTSIPRAMILSGSASKNLTTLTKSVGLDWSVQAGALQMTPKGQPLKGAIISLTRESGLLGSPSIDGKGKLTAQALLMPDILPGSTINVETRFISGNFKVERVVFTGDTYGGDWFTSIEGSRL